MSDGIRFCTASDGARLAYAMHGQGPPLVRVATWMTHLELDWGSPVWRHWLDGLGRDNTMLRYDERGCGLSEMGTAAPSLDVWIDDLETVVDAVGLDRFALLGISQGGSVAVAYAARHPERVTELLLYGAYARGRRMRGQQREQDALVAAIRAGWTNTNHPTYRRVFSMLFLPHGTHEQMQWYDELLRTTTTPERAVELYEARGGVDVTAEAEQVVAPTLVIHARGDHVVPVEEGLLLARLIPHARLMVLDSDNHILLADEPAWARFLSAVHHFKGTSVPRAPSGAAVSPRELAVLELVAAGLTNQAIARQLNLSVRTVERHLSNVYSKLDLSGKAGRAAAAVAFARLRAAADDRR